MINIPHLLNQVMLKQWAFYGSSHLGNDFFYLCNFIEIAINALGEERLVNMMKEDKSSNNKKIKKLADNWKIFRRKFSKLKLQIRISKTYYDKIEDKKMKNISNNDLTQFKECIKKFNIIEEDIYALAVFLVQVTKLKAMTIRSEDWKILENFDLKKIDTVKRRPEKIEEK